MRMLIQRVKRASVGVEGEIIGKINSGLLVFFAVHRDDQKEQINWMVEKLLGLRIFCDSEGRMNRSVQEINGSILIVSQFTLYGDCRSGRRPGFVNSAPPDKASTLYEQFVSAVSCRYPSVQTGRFAAKMEVALLNDGPVTFMIDAPT